MEHENYITRKRAKFEAICGHVNIPYGTALINQGGFLMWNGKQICGITSQNAFDFFSQNDDGRGRERGDLVSAILIQLERRDKNHQSRWNKIWADPLCQKYKRPEHEDHWLWNYAFYNAPVEDLQYIFDLIRKGWSNDGLPMAVLAWGSRCDRRDFQIPSHPDQAQFRRFQGPESGGSGAFEKPNDQ